MKSQDPGNEKSHTSSHSFPSSPSPLECAWHLTRQAREGLRNGKHKPETSQSLKENPLNTGGLVTFRAEEIEVPYL